MSPLEQIQQHLRTLRMPTAVEIVGDLLTTATRETWPLETFLSELLEQEVEGRSQRRVERLQKSSHLPAGKTLAAFDQKKLPALTTSQARQLVASTFMDEGSHYQKRLASITYHQQCNYAAYCSHRKRHQAKQHPAKRARRKTS